jgi:phosphoribosylglycinamide formyltransferase-1
VKRKLRLAVLASGNGTDLQSLIDAIKKKKINAEIRIVISNNSNAYALERARQNKIKALHLSHRQFATPEEFDEALIATLQKEKVDLICLAGYMKKLAPIVVRIFKNKIINIHPALLPAFGGEGMFGIHVHEAVIKSGVKITGVTVHFVDEVYDRGAIIYQKAVPVRDEDTPESLQKRVLKVEHKVYPFVVGLFASGEIDVKDGRVHIKSK